MKKIVLLTFMLSVMFSGSAYAQPFLHAPMDGDPNDIVEPVDPYTATGSLLYTDTHNGFGQAIKLNYDGSGRVTYDGAIDTGQMAIAAWINTDCQDEALVLFDASAPGTAGTDWMFLVMSRTTDGATNAMRFLLDFDAGAQLITVDNLNTVGWKHFVFTYDGADMKMYVDGAVVGEVLGINKPCSSWSGPLRLGEASWGAGAPSWRGDIDDLRVYNYGLTETEVSDLYDSYAVWSGTAYDPVPASPTSDTPGAFTELSWTLPTALCGDDLAVDVWFGTDPSMTTATKIVDAGTNTTSTTNFTVVKDQAYYWAVDVTDPDTCGGNVPLTPVGDIWSLTATPCVVALEADLTGDCLVNLDDFAVMAGEWLSNGN